MAVDDYRARGLYDPDAPDAPARPELLDYLTGLGATLDEMEFADRYAHITYVPVLLAVRSGPWTLHQLAARAEATPDEIREVWRALGLPPTAPNAASYDERDARMVRDLSAIKSWIGTDLGVQLLHAFGAACGQLADAAVGAFVQAVRRDDIPTSSTDLERARFNAGAVQTLEHTAAYVDTIVQHHLRAAIIRWQIAGAASPDASVRLTVGFVDLVGYTTLVHEVSIAELARLVQRLETTAIGAADGGGGRVVKFVGDAVMFVALDATAACTIALDLLETFDRERAGAAARGGLAVRQVIGRQGDYYGPVVNLESRVAQDATAGEILATEDVTTR